MPDTAYHLLVRTVARSLRQPCGVTNPARILVAVSGGADSVALLRALHHLSHRRRWKLTLAVGHVDHHLRDDSAADAAFVADLARTLKLKCFRRDLALSRDTPNLEATAREHRYAALTEMAHECGAAFVATAHHADDQLETLLMALLRGTTVKGLRGIAWRRELPPALRPPSSALFLIRPMLKATHAQAIDYLQQLDQPWREDHTNDDVTRTRARLRRDVLPVLRDLRPSAALKAAELAEHARTIMRKLNEDAAEDC